MLNVEFFCAESFDVNCILKTDFVIQRLLNLKLFNFERYRHFDLAEKSFLNLLVSIEIAWLLEHRI
ncbi:MAG: hypothetical protein CMP13_10960 [Zunongwangia sp.]|nr:hypothetical protein [Zunongwangia sp.]